MALSIQVQKGGEKFFPFAKNKLRLMKEFMRRAKLSVMRKHFKIQDVTIWISSVLVGAGESLDWIRITAGSEGTVSCMLDAETIGVDSSLLDPANDDYGLVLPADIAGLPGSFKAGSIDEESIYRGMIVNHAFAEQHPSEDIEDYLGPISAQVQAEFSRPQFRYLSAVGGGTFVLVNFGAGDELFITWISGANANAAAQLQIALHDTLTSDFLAGVLIGRSPRVSIGRDSEVGIMRTETTLSGSFPVATSVEAHTKSGASDAITRADELGIGNTQSDGIHYLAAYVYPSGRVANATAVRLSSESGVIFSTAIDADVEAQFAIAVRSFGSPAQLGYAVPYNPGGADLRWTTHQGDELIITETGGVGRSVAYGGIAVSTVGIPIVTGQSSTGPTTFEIFAKVFDKTKIALASRAFSASNAPRVSWTPDGIYAFVLDVATLYVISADGVLLGSDTVTGSEDDIIVLGAGGSYTLLRNTKTKMTSTPITIVAEPFALTVGADAALPVLTGGVLPYDWCVDDTRRPYL